ncbi:DUF2062 domain-containing protein [Pararhodospirillum photometricum]|uniref:DUF2062 domain-containing protein n=1 Tax=Pararhodospirillum photometricum TaxID=1084 RepID=UPI0002D74342|nr:DUF2062 domain-containing protein [Pararhodospirillum photometricum]
MAPRMGWRRQVRYLGRRMARLPGSPGSIALGFACGTAVAFTPLMGFHIVLGVVLAFLVRGNVLAAALGTLVGNPWTFPVICVGTYALGAPLLGGLSAPVPPDLATELSGVGPALLALDGQKLIDQLWPVLLPMLVGAVPLGLGGGLLAYVLVRQAITRARRLPSAGPSSAPAVPRS